MTRVVLKAGECLTYGLSTDTKPAASTSGGHAFFEIDTGRLFLSDGVSWNETTASGAAAWGGVTGTLSDQTDLQTALDTKAPLASPAFTGTPTGITKAHVGLGSVDNTSDAGKPVSTAQQSALDGKLNTSQFSGLAKISVGTVAPTSPSVGDLWVDTN